MEGAGKWGSISKVPWKVTLFSPAGKPELSAGHTGDLLPWGPAAMGTGQPNLHNLGHWLRASPRGSPYSGRAGLAMGSWRAGTRLGDPQGCAQRADWVPFSSGSQTSSIWYPWLECKSWGRSLPGDSDASPSLRVTERQECSHPSGSSCP